MSPEQELRVAGNTDTKMLASCIVKNHEDGRRVFLSCIGVASISQAFKAVAVANGFVAPQGYVLVMLPSFYVARFMDKESKEMIDRTAMRISVLKQRMGSTS